MSAETHSSRLCSRSKKELGRTVPESDQAWCHWPRWNAESSRQTKIGNFQASRVSEQQIGDFDVAMNDEVGVKVLETTQQLEQQTLDFRLGERFLEIVQERRLNLNVKLLVNLINVVA